MHIRITKKGIVDCTSDSREYPIRSIQEGIEAAIKVFDSEVKELDYAEFNLNTADTGEELKDCGEQIKITDKKVCLKLLNYFKENPQYLTKDIHKLHIHVKIWKFFEDGNQCSDYIDVYTDRVEISCQDVYDPDLREEFHNNVENIVGSDYAVTIGDNLISLHVNVTEKCIANCNTCYVNRGLQRELKKEDWEKLPLAECYAIGGGEPAEYPLIADFVDYLKNERKGYVSVTTNGQNKIDFNTLPDKIAVSIDGLTQEEHQLTHNTDLMKAEESLKFYRNKGISVCINHILHRKNIDNIKNFVDKWTNQYFADKWASITDNKSTSGSHSRYEVNCILFTGDDNLKPSFGQLTKFAEFFYENRNNIVIDSCMGGILKTIYDIDIYCNQGLFSAYYRFGTLMPCSHSAKKYPICSVFEEYMTYFFKTLRPMIFIYDRSGNSGAHEWAFKAGLKGKIKHNIEYGEPLDEDTIYIMTQEEEASIRKPHYFAGFENKMPYFLSYK